MPTRDNRPQLLIDTSVAGALAVGGQEHHQSYQERPSAAGAAGSAATRPSRQRWRAVRNEIVQPRRELAIVVLCHVSARYTG
jgi:hypothetical protein